MTSAHNCVIGDRYCKQLTYLLRQIISADVEGCCVGLVSFVFVFVDVVDAGNGAEAEGTWISGESPLFWLLFFFLAMIKIYLQLYWK